MRQYEIQPTLMEMIAVQYIGRLQLLGSVAAFLTCGIAFAQIFPSNADKWPGSLDDSNPKRRHAIIETAGDPGYDSVLTIRPQSPVSGIVTLHELAHRVPKQAVREFKRAWAAHGKGDREAAITYFQKAIAIDPAFCAALNDLGTTYLMTDQPDLAIEQFNKAIAVDPQAAKPPTNLAIAYLRKNQYRHAESAARRAIDLDRAGTKGHLVLGISLVMQKQFTDETERSLERAASDFPRAKLFLAIDMLGKGKTETARQQLNAYYLRGDATGMETARAIQQELALSANEKQ